MHANARGWRQNCMSMDTVIGGYPIMNSIVYYGNIYSLIFLLRDLILSTTPLLSKNDNELTEMYEIGLKPITHFYFSKYKFCDLPGNIKWPI